MEEGVWGGDLKVGGCIVVFPATEFPALPIVFVSHTNTNHTKYN